MKSNRKEVHKSRKRRGREIEMSLSSPRESQRREKNESYKSGKALVDYWITELTLLSLSQLIQERRREEKHTYCCRHSRQKL